MNIIVSQRLYRSISILLIFLVFTSLLLLPTKPVHADTLIVDGGVIGYTTIQEAVNAANPGDVIDVRAGTYLEQVVIQKALTLISNENAVIRPPETLISACNSPSLTNYPLICVEGVEATVWGFTIDGMDKAGGLYPRYFGIAYRNAGGSIIYNNISGIRGVSLDNTYMAVGIYVYNSDTSTPRNIQVAANTIANFHKNAISITTQEWLAPLTFTVINNVIVGTPNSTVAQNGIQIQASFGSGIIENNTISDIAYNNYGDPTPSVAVSILNLSTSVETRLNTITGAQLGIYYYDGSGRINNNNIQVIKPGSGSTLGKNVYGVVVGDRIKDTVSPIDPIVPGASLLAPSAVTRYVEIDNNTILYQGTNLDNTYGIEVDSGFGPNDESILIRYNQVGSPEDGWDKGIAIYQCDSAGGSPCSTGKLTDFWIITNDISGNNTGLYFGGTINPSVNYAVTHNRLVNNQVGVENFSPKDLDISGNWWGCNEGPNQTGCDTVLASGSGIIGFDPWLVLKTTISPPNIIPGNSSMVTADIRYDSSGVIPILEFLPDSLPVEFSVKTGGSVFPEIGTYTLGLSSATFTAPATTGDYEVCATTDNQEVCSTVSVVDPLDLSSLTLLQSTDGTTWTPTAGSLAGGFTVGLNPTTPWYYLNVTDIVVNRPLVDGMHPFYLTSHPAGYLDYWAAKGVDGTPPYAEPWMEVMWEIINGTQPIFYLRVDGTPPMLVDGLQFIASEGAEINPLRVNGDYFPGSYTFSGDVTDSLGLKDTVDVDVTFVTMDNWIFLPLIFR